MGSNGLLSFGWAYNSYYNQRLSARLRDYIIAPFWDFIYTGRGGRVLYEVHVSGYFLEQVNTFLQIKHPSNFNGTWMLVAYWDAVHSPYWDDYGKVYFLVAGASSFCVYIYCII